jgi:hypothetical protein
VSRNLSAFSSLCLVCTLCGFSRPWKRAVRCEDRFCSTHTQMPPPPACVVGHVSWQGTVRDIDEDSRGAADPRPIGGGTLALHTLLFIDGLVPLGRLECDLGCRLFFDPIASWLCFSLQLWLEDIYASNLRERPLSAVPKTLTRTSLSCWPNCYSTCLPITWRLAWIHIELPGQVCICMHVIRTACIYAGWVIFHMHLDTCSAH